MMEQRIIFHIGLPKTGTTFLQKNVFPYIKEITYFNCIEYWRAEDKMFLNPFFLQFNSGVNLISDERICGLGYLNHPYISMLDRIRTLKKVYPEAEIIFVTRDLEYLTVSLYKQYGKYSYGVLNFNEWFDTELDLSMITGIHDTIEYIVKNFKDSLILDYGKLLENQDGFIQEITDFLGAPRLTEYNRKRLHVSPKNEAVRSIIKLNRSRLPWWIKKPIRLVYRQNHN